jgi:beta-N-acetylhexosaminidase
MPVVAPTALEARVGQMLFAGFDGLEPPDYLLDWLRAGRIGGVILFARNVATPAQVAALTDALQAAAAYGVIISIDQEGGTVARLREGFSESPGAMALASAREHESLVERVSHMLASELRALGIHWDYAPVVDIHYEADNPSMGTRTFSSDPALVSRLGAAAVRGLQAAGVAASPKHFPSASRTAIDTHIALPALDTPLDLLRTIDLMPYRAAIEAGAASVMVTHVLYRALDAHHPSTLSPVVVRQLLRGELAYDGVVTTDCLEMQAITDHYGSAEAAVLAALAGIDAILFSHTRARQEAAYDGLLHAVQSGRVPLAVVDDANRRLAAFKARFVQPRTDLSAIRAPEHWALAADAARAGTTLLRRGSALPLRGRIGVIEIASAYESGIDELDGLSGLGRCIRARLPEAATLVLSGGALTPEAEALAAASDTLVLAVRNAHRSGEKLQTARALLRLAGRTVLVCLRNPHDAAALPEADTVLCTCGDSTPSLEAAAAALLGEFQPEGRLPIEIAHTWPS